MKEKTIYDRPQVDVVDAYPEKAYCSNSGYNVGNTEEMESQDGEW
jgi:hypothetical protein